MSADTNKPNLDEAAGSGASTDPASSLDIDAQQVDHLLIVKAFADDLDLVKTVNRLAPSQMAVKPGLIVLGLVLDREHYRFLTAEVRAEARPSRLPCTA